ncbi:hypothetical protein [Costertonia aggregata]|uniref:Uncharacterized protein n=1 Tax=Costertonia aggregata TaxID=343403 RepID=A0A7H9ARC4_9FLAO|nr:hypothetical protein [Costertonia aggregata]QLG46041.1 hypothetical protein HYG79_12030 [Costertonia aggregata]
MNQHEPDQIDDLRKLFLDKNKDCLKSFTNEYQVINFLAIQKTYFYFLTAIRAVKGLRLALYDDKTTSIVFNDREIEGTRKMRFENTDEIEQLLTLSGLN